MTLEIQKMVEDYEDLVIIIKDGINKYIEDYPLTLQASIDLEDKTISEIGGRIIEDYMLKIVENIVKNNNKYNYKSVEARSMGDFLIISKGKIEYKFYFDIKTQHLSIRKLTEAYYKKHKINKKKPGESHPNLMSYEKALNFFCDDESINDDIALVMVEYDPTFTKSSNVGGHICNFNIKKLTDRSIFLIRHIDESNLSVGNLGKGQVQLSKLNNIILTSNSKAEFVKILEKLRNTKKITRKSSK